MNYEYFLYGNNFRIIQLTQGSEIDAFTLSNGRRLLLYVYPKIGSCEKPAGRNLKDIIGW